MPTAIENPVSSFETGIITVKNDAIGICIKFKYFDGTVSLSHWPAQQLARLMKAFSEYIDTGRHNQFMFKAKDNASLVASLPARHPYHTLLTEKPEITETEIGTSTRATRVQESSYSDRGPTFVLKLTFADLTDREIYMHEYTAFSLFGYLNEYIEAFEKLSEPPQGLMH